jgi:hypothetical protein
MTARSKNSPKTGAGVMRRRGKGPFHGVITGCRVKRMPAGEVETTHI